MTDQDEFKLSEMVLHNASAYNGHLLQLSSTDSLPDAEARECKHLRTEYFAHRITVVRQRTADV